MSQTFVLSIIGVICIFAGLSVGAFIVLTWLSLIQRLVFGAAAIAWFVFGLSLCIFLRFDTVLLVIAGLIGSGVSLYFAAIQMVLLHRIRRARKRALLARDANPAVARLDDQIAAHARSMLGPLKEVRKL
jgi:hypothetical protein